MTTNELRNELISRISSVKDRSVLEGIKTLLDSKFINGRLILNEQQKKDIEVSRKEFQEGKFITHEELDKEIRAWLNEK